MLLLEAKRAAVPSDVRIDGSPYMPVEFEPAFIRTKKGSFNDVPCRYNAFDDNVEYQLRGLAYEFDPSPNVELIKFKTYDMVVDKLPVKDYRYGFYIRLDSGKATLLMRRTIQLLSPQAPKALESEGKPARYSARPDEFYLKFGSGIPQPVGSVKKSIAMFPDHQAELQKFVAEHKLSKSAEDLARLVEYYNTLP